MDWMRPVVPRPDISELGWDGFEITDAPNGRAMVVENNSNPMPGGLTFDTSGAAQKAISALILARTILGSRKHDDRALSIVFWNLIELQR